MLVHISKLIERGRAVASADPIDWGTIRGIYLSLSLDAGNALEKDAVHRLRDAASTRQAHDALNTIERVFLEGKRDAEGNPRYF